MAGRSRVSGSWLRGRLGRGEGWRLQEREGRSMKTIGSNQKTGRIYLDKVFKVQTHT